MTEATMTDERLDALLNDLEDAVLDYERNHDSYRREGKAEARAAIASFFSETVKWVPVSERVPDDGVRVLGFWPTPKDEPMSASSYGIAVRWNGSWYSADDDDDLYGDATHWMPLPEAPK